MPADSLSAAEARRIALAAQGFSGGSKRPARRPFDTTLGHLNVLQIDSVNVFSRSHYVPVFSRQGSYDRDALDQLLWHSGEYTEYWAHEAAFIPVDDRPLFGWRMADFRARHSRDDRAIALQPMIERVRAALGDRGPQFVRELEAEPRASRGPWWDWSDTKHAVEVMFARGEVVSSGREGFQRRYALAEHALPSSALAEVPRDEAQIQLIARAAHSLGIGTLGDLADYYRLSQADTRVAVRALVEQGIVRPVTVEGWRRTSGDPEPAWLHRDARLPARLSADALLTPFDPVVWYRPRAERMFDFHYRIEIYTPKEKRQFGYYCLPLMVGGTLAGRIDLKADRPSGRLLVQAAWQEPRAHGRTSEAAISLLARAAAWQDLDVVHVSGAGNLPLPSQFDAAA